MLVKFSVALVWAAMAPTGKLFIAYVSYILIGVLFPVMDISLNSMLPVMTEDMGGLLYGFVPLVRFVNVTNVPLLIDATFVSGFGMGLTLPLGYGIQADNTDYVEYFIR